MTVDKGVPMGNASGSNSASNCEGQGNANLKRSTPNTNNSSSNKYKNNRGKNKSAGNGNTHRFKGAVKHLSVIGVRNDQYRTNNFLTFQRSIENHVLSTFNYSGDIAYLVQVIENPMPRLMKMMPTLKSLKKDYGIDENKHDSELTTDELAMVEELKELLATGQKAFVSRKGALQANYPTLFGLIWGQCMPSLQQDLRNLQNYKDAYDTRHCLWLMTELKKSATGSDDMQHEFLTFIRTVRALFTTRQKDTKSIQGMVDRLDSQQQALKLIGGHMWQEYLVKGYKTKNTNITDAAAREYVEEKLMAILTIEGANKGQYGPVKHHLANQMVHGVDLYPDTRSQAQTILSKYIPSDKSNKGSRNHVNGNSKTNDTNKVNVTFMQTRAAPREGPPVPGTDGKLHQETRCFKCGFLGHYSNLCSYTEGNGFQGFQCVFVQRSLPERYLPIQPNWSLIDSGSTCSSVKDHQMLESCTDCDSMTAYTNGGQLTYKMQGPVCLLPRIKAFLNGAAIANIINCLTCCC